VPRSVPQGRHPTAAQSPSPRFLPSRPQITSMTRSDRRPLGGQRRHGAARAGVAALRPSSLRNWIVLVRQRLHQARWVSYCGA
jgi:hypothetical protein